MPSRSDSPESRFLRRRLGRFLHGSYRRAEKKREKIWLLCRQYENAKQALDMGLVNTVVPLADLEKETVGLGARNAANSPMALRLLKAALNAD